MKCPLKFRLYPFEGGQECDPECAWRLGGEAVVDDERTIVYMCAIANIGVDEKLPTAIANWEERR